MSKVQDVSVISFLSFCIIVGSLVFSRGFLLNRQVINERSGPCANSARKVLVTPSTESSIGGGNGGPSSDLSKDSDNSLSSACSWCERAPPFNKMVMILVDALRFDFVQRMQFLSKVTSSKRPSSLKFNSNTYSKDAEEVDSSSCLFKFVADPPTTTMQRLKALMTGTMPTFIDASANFNSYEVEEDSLIYQLDAAGKRIAFLGDDTWLSLFPKSLFKSPHVEAHPSFNAWDLDTVDRAVNKTLREILLPSKINEWDILITHLLGVDHCGHRYGPNHPEMARKLHEADTIIEHVFNSVGNDTLLVVFGDHGMTESGDHGGDSKEETEAAVIFISKNIKRNRQIYPPFQCSKDLAISQIDLVPTLSPLLGIPIPYSNIGQIIPDFLANKTYSDAVAANVAQVNRYIQHFPMMLSAVDDNIKEQGNLRQQYKKIEEAFKEYQSSRNSTTRANLHKLSQLYLTQVKSIAVSTWTQFHLPMIYTGILISFLGVLSLYLYLAIVPKLFNRRVKRDYSVLSWLWPSLSHWSVLCTFVSYSASSASLLGIVVSTLSGVFMFLLLLIFKSVKSIMKKNSFKCSSGCNQCIQRGFNLHFLKQLDYSEVVSFLVYIVTCGVVFSNSFVINEGYFLATMLLLVLFLRIVWSNRLSDELGNEGDMRSVHEDDVTKIPSVRRNFRCSWSCFLLFAVILRTSTLFFRCREEQTTCSEEFLLHKQLSSLPEAWVVHKCLRYGISLLALAVFVVSFRHWMMHRRCIFSKKPRAVIARFIPSLLVVLLGIFWALQGLPYISSHASKFRLLMNHLPLVYQTVTISSIVLVWLNPICCMGHFNSYYFSKVQKTSEIANNKPTFADPDSNQDAGISITNEPIANRFGKLATKNSIAKTTNGFKILNCTNGFNLSTTISKPLGCASRALVNERRTGYSSNEMFNESISGCTSNDTFSSCFLTFGILVTLLLVQTTSAGIAPAIILEAYAIVCLVGVYWTPNTKDSGSWSAAVAWTLSSQYFFYATGHQPIFSAIPWDSAFIGGGDASGLASTSGSWIAWSRAALSVIGNLHASQIMFSLSLPLLIYWKISSDNPENIMGKSERRKAYLLCGKFIALHSIKLLMCMCCAALHRRHLMVWKIFAPKFIFEAISFIFTSSCVLLTMVLTCRIHYFHQKNISRINQRVV